MCFHLLCIAFVLIVSSSCNVFKLVSVCPDKLQWKERMVKIHCQKYKSYHCLKLQNGSLAEVCAEPRGISADGCPIYDAIQKKIKAVKCIDEDMVCPTKAYTSDTMYKYSACLMSRMSSPTTSSMLSTQSQMDQTSFKARSTLPKIEHVHFKESMKDNGELILYVAIGIAVILGLLFIVNLTAILSKSLQRTKMETRNVESVDASTNTETRDSGIYNDIEWDSPETGLNLDNKTYLKKEYREDILKISYEEPVKKMYEHLDSKDVMINREKEAAKQYEDFSERQTEFLHSRGAQIHYGKCSLGQKRNSI